MGFVDSYRAYGGAILYDETRYNKASGGGGGGEGGGGAEGGGGGGTPINAPWGPSETPFCSIPRRRCANQTGLVRQLTVTAKPNRGRWEGWKQSGCNSGRTCETSERERGSSIFTPRQLHWTEIDDRF